MMEKTYSLLQALLLYIADRPMGISQKEISDKIGINITPKTVALNKLINLGLLEKIPMEKREKSKKRVSYLYRTTTKGREEYRRYLGMQTISDLKEASDKLQKASKEYYDQVNEILKIFEERLMLLASTQTVSFEETFSEADFLYQLKTAYAELVRMSPIAPMVRISDLRTNVMEKLKISKEQFDKRLVYLSEKDPYRVQLFTGSESKEEGVQTKKGICHYVLLK